MTGQQLRQAYLDFFKEAPKNHEQIPSARIVPKEDPTTLFTSSGMQPLIPYLLGQDHPKGKRLVNSQKCFRSQDIEEVGDNRHTTFFEMLGNWSLGNYFKKEQLHWFFEFLTSVVHLDPKKIYVTVFDGDKDFKVVDGKENAVLEPDVESVSIWKELFNAAGVDHEVANDNDNPPDIKNGRIFYYGVAKNWWSRSGIPQNMPIHEIGGPCSEVFYDFGEDLKLHENSPHKNDSCHPNCDCGRFLEIGNSVFIQYKKISPDTFEELPQKNVDFGGGLIRILAALNNDPDVFKTDLFWPLIEKIETLSGKKYDEDSKSQMRVIADHLNAATFMISEGLEPSNKQQGYILRRLLRRAAMKMYQLKGELTKGTDFEDIAKEIVRIYPNYFEVEPQLFLISQEMEKFSKALDRGYKEIEKYSQSQLNAQNAFDLYQTYGFPFEVTQELYQQKGITLEKKDFEEIANKHQDLSRSTSKGMFRGGLADHSETTTKYHTATHLIHQALRQILGDHVQQVGSNITAERLRFDFTHFQALTEDEIQKIQDLINDQIKANLAVTKEESSFQKAKEQGALAFFGERYPDTVTVYSIGSFSKEVCGGPHVENTGVIGPIEIFKQESVGSGRRRLYARLSN